jgi:hypothetical protein
MDGLQALIKCPSGLAEIERIQVENLINPFNSRGYDGRTHQSEKRDS